MSTEAPFDLQLPDPPPDPPLPRTPGVEAGLARLVTQFRQQPKIEAVLRSLLGSVQEAQEAIESLRNGRALRHAVGAQLDGIGQIVGLERGTMGDEEYRHRLGIQIRVNLANGTPEDILETLALVLGRTVGIRLTETFPAEMTVVVEQSVPYPAGKAAAETLRQIKPAGVRALLEWGADPATMFCFEGGVGLGFDEGLFTDVEAG